MARKRQIKEPEKQPVIKRSYASRKRVADDYLDTYMDGLIPTNDTVLERLGEPSYEAYKNVLIDGQVKTVRETREANVKGLKMKIVQDESTEDVVKFCEENFKRLKGEAFQDDFISMCLKANDYGMGPIEVSWAVENGKALVSALTDIPARYFKFDDKFNLRFLSKANPFVGEPVKPRKILLPRNNPSFDNPYGEALLSLCYWPVLFKRNATKWWNRLTEKYGFPWVLAKQHSDPGTQEIIDYVANLAAMMQDGVAAVPKDDEVELMDTGAKANPDMFEGLLKYNDAVIAKIYLGQALTTDLGDYGSRAASETGKDIIGDRTRMDQRMIENIGSTLLTWMTELNFGNVKPPKMVLEDPIGINLEQAQRDNILYGTGWDFTKDYMIRTYNFKEGDIQKRQQQEIGPRPKEEEDEEKSKKDFAQGGIIGATGAIPAFLNSDETVQQKTIMNRFKEALFTRARFKDQRGIDAAVEALTASKDTAKMSRELLAPIQKIVNNSDSYDEALANLSKAWKDMDPSDLEETLMNSLFVADTVGRFGAGAEL